MKKDKLEISKYPKVYQNYLKKEKELVIDFLKGSENVLDVGCGTGRIILSISNLAKKYVGVDTNDAYLKTAKEASKNLKNVEIIKLDAENLSKKFRKKEFDKTISIWNTIGCLADDRKSIEEISKVTNNGLFFTVIQKGTLQKRKEYYKKFSIDYKIDGKTEAIKSKEWSTSRAYSKNDIKNLINGYFKIQKIKTINNFAYAVYAENYK